MRAIETGRVLNYRDKGDEYLKKATEKPAKKDDKPADKPKSDG